MIEVVKLSKYSIGGAVVTYLIQSLLLLFAIFLVSELPWPPSFGDSLYLLSITMLFWISIPGVYRLIEIPLRRLHRGELSFDGTTVTVRIPGGARQEFTQPDVKAYFPHRNEVLLTDGRLIALTSCMPRFNFNEIAMARPWVNAWWPDLDLSAAVREADRRQAWLRYLPNATMLLVLIAIIIAYMAGEHGEAEFGLALMSLALFLQFSVPDWLEGRLRRKAVIHFPCGDSVATRRSQDAR